MNTMLVMMVYIQSLGWVPQYVVAYDSQLACQAIADKYSGKITSESKAVCLPRVEKR